MHRIVRTVWVTAGLSFTAWLVWNAQAHDLPAGVFDSTDAVAFRDTGATLEFRPAAATPATPGLIFLPGGMVDARAYAPLARRVAEAGHPAVIVRLPWRSAPTGGSRRTVWRRILDAQDGTRPWLLAGHSRGAALAGRFAAAYPDRLGALVLVGTTHPRDHDLSSLTVPVAKVYGTRDCVADPEAMRDNAGNLPASTLWVEIEGGNHAQFGFYGTQLGDCSASIPRAEQQRRTLEVLVEVLADLAGFPVP